MLSDYSETTYVPLDHKVGDDAMESTALVMQGFARFAHPFFTGAQGTEIVDCSGDGIAKQSQYDTTRRCTTNVNVKKHLVCDLFQAVAVHRGCVHGNQLRKQRARTSHCKNCEKRRSGGGGH